MKTTRKELQQALKHLRKARHEEMDRLSSAKLEKFDTFIKELDVAAHAKPFDEAGTKKWIDRAEILCNEVLPRKRNPVIAENVDVILVALVVALGVRSYFLQPFKIPTNSMFPTLRGVVIEAQPPEVKFPGAIQQFAEKIFFGRTYIEFTVPEGAVFEGAKSGGVMLLNWLTFHFEKDGKPLQFKFFTDAQGGDLTAKFAKQQFPKPGTYRAVIDTGDHLFVNKVTYHFCRPERGDSFVFRTAGLNTSHNLMRQGPWEGSQYYIKRCVGQGGDTLRVDPPKLYVNGQEAQEKELQKVWNGAESDPRYKGYSNGDITGQRMPYLGDASDTVDLPKDFFWAMGDNSYNSADSRVFGPVPLRNVVGKALIIYYPFNRKFWLIE